MPTWLQIVIAVFGLISTLFGIFGISAYISERAKHKAKKQNDAEDEAEKKKIEEQKKLEQMKHDEYVEELKEVINAAVAPVISKLNDVEEDLSLVKGGLQKDLYVDLTHIYNEHAKKGFATISEKRDFDSLYWAYHKLGKNGVADGMHETVMNMPDVKPAPRKRTTKKKQVLLEDK